MEDRKVLVMTANLGSIFDEVNQFNCNGTEFAVQVYYHVALRIRMNIYFNCVPFACIEGLRDKPVQKA